MDEIKKKMKEKAKAVLQHDMWTCMICDKSIVTNSSVASNDEKTTLLVQHIKENHKDSQDVDPNIDDQFLVLYFSPNKKLV